MALVRGPGVLLFAVVSETQLLRRFCRQDCIRPTFGTPRRVPHERFDVVIADGVGWHQDVLSRPIARNDAPSPARFQALAPLSDQHGALKHHVRLPVRRTAEG
eukprot:scaffold927_cov375-Prasinococcus_capsulatus_cf.AAC.6